MLELELFCAAVPVAVVALASAAGACAGAPCPAPSALPVASGPAAALTDIVALSPSSSVPACSASDRAADCLHTSASAMAVHDPPCVPVPVPWSAPVLAHFFAAAPLVMEVTRETERETAIVMATA